MNPSLEGDVGALTRIRKRAQAGTVPPTSKNVYDSVIVLTSRDILGSITNATGQDFFSPGSSVYWLKQKHCSLLK
jgi:hypothetical protein